MAKKKLFITQQTISNKTGRPIKSPIRIGKIKEWHLNLPLLSKLFTPLFDTLPDRSFASADFVLTRRGAKFFIKIEKNTPDKILPDHFIENHIFATLLAQFYKMVQKVYPEEKTSISVYFFRKKITKDLQKNISQNNIEKGNDLITELVVNRMNIKGGETQVLEKLKKGSKEIIYQHTLQAGEFIFLLNDLKESNNNGAVFSYATTDISVEDISKKESWRDIIGFKMNIL